MDMKIKTNCFESDLRTMGERNYKPARRHKECLSEAGIESLVAAKEKEKLRKQIYHMQRHASCGKTLFYIK